jgi:hypothetical protein
MEISILLYEFDDGYHEWKVVDGTNEKNVLSNGWCIGRRKAKRRAKRAARDVKDGIYVRSV